MCERVEEKPWGYYVVLHDRKILVKKLVIFPHHRTSHQFHNHRDEHWYWVAGQGSVVLAGHEYELGPNTPCPFVIKSKQEHWVSNTGRDDLVFIEIQTGELISESDLVRIYDPYDRESEE